MESTFPVGFGGNHEFATGSPDDWIAYLQLEQIPTEFTMLGESGAADHSNNHSTAAGAGVMEVNADGVQGQAVVDAPSVVNAGLAHPQPDPYSTGDTSCCAAAADTGSISLHPEVNAPPQSGDGCCGGGGLAEAAVRGSCKRIKLARGSSSQRSRLLLEFEYLPPAGSSTDLEILTFVKRRSFELPDGQEVNRSVAEQDQTAPVAARSYTTTVAMMSDQKTPRGYWKEKQSEAVRDDESRGIPWSGFWGLKKTFQFHRYDGTKTNWFMHEHIPAKYFGLDLYMEDLRFREVYQGAEVEDPGEPTSPEVKIKNKTAAAKKHRMREPENLVIKGESPAWQHFIKIYDRHPELEGSKVVYAVCFHCQGVLKAGTDNGTKSLLTHCNRTCPIKNKNQLQPG